MNEYPPPPPQPPPPPSPSQPPHYPPPPPPYSQPPHYPAYPGYAPSPYLVRRRNALATWSLVLACLSICCGVLTAIPAVICGHIAISQIRRDPAEGFGLAVAGLVIGYIAIGLSVLYLLVRVALFVVHPGPTPTHT